MKVHFNKHLFFISVYLFNMTLPYFLWQQWIQVRKLLCQNKPDFWSLLSSGMWYRVEIYQSPSEKFVDFCHNIRHHNSKDSILHTYLRQNYISRKPPFFLQILKYKKWRWPDHWLLWIHLIHFLHHNWCWNFTSCKGMTVLRLQVKVSFSKYAKCLRIYSSRQLTTARIRRS